MCEAFAKNGHETILVGKQFDSNPIRDAYDYYGVQRNFELALLPCRKIKGIGLLLLPKLYAWLRRYDPKEVLIYARDIYGASLAVRMGYRVIYEAHAAPYNHLINRLEAALLKNRQLIRLVVISESLKNIYACKFNVTGNVVVCHDAAALPNESPNTNITWPTCRDTLQIGYTGHLYQGRGIEVIIECAKRLPQYDFHIIGGTGSDISYWKAKAMDNLYFHGFLEPALVHRACARCDVLLMPYQKTIVNPHSNLNTVPWMSPMKLFEYMASQRAIIASDLPVLWEVLDERMAVLVQPDKPDEWVDAIKRCEDRAYRQSLAENAYKAFREHYTWEKRAQKVLDGLDV